MASTHFRPVHALLTLLLPLAWATAALARKGSAMNTQARAKANILRCIHFSR